MLKIGEGAILANLENGRKDTSSAQPFSASPNFNWDGDDDEAHHVDHHFPKSLLLFPRQVDEDITFWVLKQLEGDGQVMVLQHGLVVVHQSQLRAWQKERISVDYIRLKLVSPTHLQEQVCWGNWAGGDNICVEKVLDGAAITTTIIIIIFIIITT